MPPSRSQTPTTPSKAPTVGSNPAVLVLSPKLRPSNLSLEFVSAMRRIIVIIIIYYCQAAPSFHFDFIHKYAFEQPNSKRMRKETSMIRLSRRLVALDSKLSIKLGPPRAAYASNHVSKFVPVAGKHSASGTAATSYRILEYPKQVFPESRTWWVVRGVRTRKQAR